MPSKKILYPRFGVINDIDKPLISPRVDLRKSSFQNVYKKMVEAVYTPNALQGTGPYKGIVLRVDGKPDAPLAKSWVSNFFGAFSSEDKISAKLVSIKVRIPEIHSMLPIPDILGDESEEHNIIEMYPTFIAQTTETPIPNVGSLVWVDFGNKVNFTDPIYLMPVDSSQATPPGGGSLSGKDAHKSLCPGRFSSETPNGDSLAGASKPLSHVGGPLNQRKSASTASEEFVFLKGLRFSEIKLKKWEKAIRSKGVSGRTWIGINTNNGIEDKEHKYGKRNTIIFSPNTTDFISSIELIYYFHGSGEFDDDFESRIAPSIKELTDKKRNFVIVIPELPWSIDSNNKNRDAWVGLDDFGNFHSETIEILKEYFSKVVQIKLITIIGYSVGGKALKTACQRGFSSVKPNKIVFADASYGDYAQVVWDRYVSINPNVEFDLLCKESGSTNIEAKKIYEKISNKQNVNFQEMKGKNQKQIGDISISYNGEKYDSLKQLEEEKMLEESEGVEIDPNQIEPMIEPKSDSKNAIQPESFSPMSQNSDVSTYVFSKSQTTKKTNAIVKESVPFEEARVRVSDYASLKGNEDVLVPYPCSIEGRTALVHKLVAKRLEAMNNAWLQENPGETPIKLNNGFRMQRWQSEADYNSFLMSSGYNSIEEGKKWVAFESPHQTGLAIDIGNNGLNPNKNTNEQQKQTKLYKWMKNNAHKYGFSPYKIEAWHWECRLPRESWASGEEFTNNLAVRVEVPGSGGTIPTTSYYGTECITSLGDIMSNTKNLLANLGNNSVGQMPRDKKKELIEKLSSELNIEPEMAYAFQKVESGGRSGFDSKGRLMIRFEPHVFANKDRMKQFGVTSDKIPWYDNTSSNMKKKWEEIGTEKGWNHRSQDGEYAALQYAIGINEEMAYNSISLGAFQVMGYYFKMMGFSSAKQMYEAFSSSEELQIRSFFVYATKRQGMLAALREKNYLKSAELYNGKSSQAPLYASKIENYYNQYKRQGIG